MREKPLILLVDDDEDFLEIMHLKLRATGYDTAGATSEGEALAFAKEQGPDLILLDVYIPPGPTGIAIAASLKNFPETRDIKIAFLTSISSPLLTMSQEDREVSEELRNEAVLDKGDDLNELIRKVQYLLTS